MERRIRVGRLVVVALVGLVVVGGCTTTAASLDPASALATPSPHPTPTASPVVTMPPATASPSPSAATPSPHPTPTASPSVTPAPGQVPPKPTGVTFDEQVRELAGGSYEITFTVTWREPRIEGVDILVSGVTECVSMPSDPQPGTSGPCLVVHTPLPSSVRRLIAGAPAMDGSISWTWPVVSECSSGWEMIGPDQTRYVAVVLAAYNGPEHSIFAIAEPGWWSIPAPGDIVC